MGSSKYKVQTEVLVFIKDVIKEKSFAGMTYLAGTWERAHRPWPSSLGRRMLAPLPMWRRVFPGRGGAQGRRVHSSVYTRPFLLLGRSLFLASSETSAVRRDLTNDRLWPFQRFAAVIMRIREPRTTALIFSSGKMVCTGAKRWVWAVLQVCVSCRGCRGET